MIRKHLVTVLILVAALGLYGAGMAMPANILLLLGLLVELAFWGRLFGRRA